MFQQTQHQFALVLIDGDGYLFEDRFLKDGEAGAIAVGNMLCEHVRTQLRNQNPKLASDLDVIVRVYVNKKGLANVLVEAGVLEDIAQLDTFFVKLTQCQPLFDVVDCGSGKERVDEKIRGNYFARYHRAKKSLIQLYRVISPLRLRLTLSTYNGWLLPRQWLCRLF